MTFPRPVTIVFFVSIIAFQIFQLFSLPLQITFDGHGYIFLANIIGTQSMVADWDLLRTPLYPFLLRISFLIFGEGPLAIKFVNTASFTVGLLLLFKLLRNHVPRKTAYLGTLLIAFFPLFIVYQHVALSECTTFACIALIMFATSNYIKQPHSRAYFFLVWVAIVLGFYARPTLVYLSLPVAFVVLMARANSAKSILKNSTIALALIIGSFAAAYPWLAATKSAGREATQIAFGMMNQALPAPEDEIMSDIRPQYEDAIQQSLREGRLGASGIWDPLVYAMGDRLYSKYGKDLDRQFLSAIFSHPLRYLQGVKRGFGLLTGEKGIDSDNQTLLSVILASQAPAVTIDAGPVPQEQYTQKVFFDSRQFTSILSQPLSTINQWNWAFVRLACLASAILLFFGLFRWDALLVLSTSIPLFFLLFHAGILFSLDRMAVPVWPLCLANIVILFWKATGWMRKSSIA